MCCGKVLELLTFLFLLRHGPKTKNKNTKNEACQTFAASAVWADQGYKVSVTKGISYMLTAYYL